MTRRRDFLSGLAASGAVQAAPASKDGPVGLGLIGAGNRGFYLGRTAAQLGDARVVAVSDIYQPRLERAAQKLGAREYAKADDLIADPNVRAVIVATPDRHHVYHALAAVRAGKDVYSEKPATHWQQFDQLKTLVAEVRRRNAVYQMGTQRLADPIWRQAAEAIRRGDIGKPVHAQMGYFRKGDSGERGMKIDDPNARPGVGLDWEAFQGDAPRRPFSLSRFFQWRLFMDYSGGPCTDNDVHFLALIIKALGANFPSRVAALGGKYVYTADAEREVPDTFDLVVEYPEGLNLTFVGTYGNDTNQDTVIRGTEGTFTIHYADAEVTGKRHLELTRLDVNAEHLRDFLRAVRTREKPQGDIELAYRTQVLLIMAMRSFVERKVMAWDAAAEQIVAAS